MHAACGEGSHQGRLSWWRARSRHFAEVFRDEVSQPGGRRRRPPGNEGRIVAPLFLFFASLLSGVIDIHAHCAPDSVPRAIDAIDLAKLAKARGMRGLVLKNHWEPTASVAYLVRKEVPGIEVFGGIDLN